MSAVEIEQNSWFPLQALGLTDSYWRLDLGVILHTWVVLAVIIALIISVRLVLQNKRSLLRHMIMAFARVFRDMIVQSMGEFNFDYFSFIISLFTFILLCNLLPIVPWFDEPTSNVNTTFALGITGFLFTQAWGIRAHGVWGYIKTFFHPFFLMFPLNVVEKLASIVSLSFRLFGNIFGGMIISKMWLSAIGGNFWFELVATFSGVNFIVLTFFVLFEGFIQAFVFSMLSLTYLTLVVKGEE